MSSLELFANLVVDGLVTGCIYALIAIGFSLLWSVSNIIHLAHGGVMLVAGFAVFLVAAPLGMPLPVAVLAAVAVAVAMGVGLDRALYQPLHERNTEELGVLTASLGALIVCEYVLVIAFGPEGVVMDAGGFRTPLVPHLILVLDGYGITAIGVTVLVFVSLGLMLSRTRIGREMRAVAANPELARALGIEVRKVGRYAAALAAALVVPATAFLLYNTGVRPIEALHLVLVAAIVSIIGGRGSVIGALVAGLVVGIAESATVWYADSGWRLMITFIILYVLMLLRPQGLFGNRA